MQKLANPPGSMAPLKGTTAEDCLVHIGVIKADSVAERYKALTRNPEVPSSSYNNNNNNFINVSSMSSRG